MIFLSLYILMSLHFNKDKKSSNIIAYVKEGTKRVNNLCLLDEGSDANDLKLNDKYKFALAPRKLSEKERSVLFVGVWRVAAMTM